MIKHTRITKFTFEIKTFNKDNSEYVFKKLLELLEDEIYMNEGKINVQEVEK